MAITSRPPILPRALYRQRRTAVMRVLRNRHQQPVPLLVLGTPSADTVGMPTPLASRWRQDPWFDWFCGCRESGAALLLDPTTRPRDTLFLDPGDPKRELWEGPRLGPGAEARRLHDVHATAPIDDLRDRVLAAAERAGGVCALCWRRVEPGVQSREARRWRRRLRGVRTINAEIDLVPLRMVKHPDEIAWHRRAVAVTATGFLAAMRALPDLTHESEAAALLTRHFLAPGNEPLAFAPIAAGGAHAATLHYPHNDAPLPERGPVLLDAGASAGGYAADVTRTLPRSGRFDDPRLRELYQLVLRCNQLAITHARPGITLKELNEICWAPILDAGLTKAHGLGHHLGLDVHDPCDRSCPLAPGMLITDEPGVYLADEGIGIRIEDDLLITADGCEVTTAAIPKTIPAIERAMAGA